MSDATESGKRAMMEMMNRELAAADEALKKRDEALAGGLFVRGDGARVPVSERFDLPRENDTFIERPQRLDYICAYANVGAFSLQPSVERCPGDEFDNIIAGLKEEAAKAGHEPWPDPMAAAHYLGQCILARWPGRAYYVEVWQSGHEGFARVFQMPKRR